MTDLDPHWEWHEVTTIGDTERRYIKGYCKHLETVPVELTMTGELVARLCLTCDAQLDVPWPDATMPQLIISFPGIVTEHELEQARDRFRRAVTTQRPMLMREDDHHG